MGRGAPSEPRPSGSEKTILSASGISFPGETQDRLRRIAEASQPDEADLQDGLGLGLLSADPSLTSSLGAGLDGSRRSGPRGRSRRRPATSERMKVSLARP